MSTDFPPTQTSPIGAPMGAPTATHHDLSTMLAREPCANCGAPLGADQRYCLSCGIPRPGTRLPFLDVLHTEAAAAGAIDAASQPTALLRIPALAPAGGRGSAYGGGGRWGGENGIAAKLRESSGLFALLGVLLLALLIGLLLGHWAGGGSRTVAAAAPSKQVIEVKGLSFPAAAAAAPVASTAGAATTAGTPSASESSTPAASTHTNGAPPANSSPTVSKLAHTTGKEHAKEVEKALANGKGTLSTGGAPPPKETGKSHAKGPIGGGSEVTSIE